MRMLAAAAIAAMLTAGTAAAQDRTGYHAIAAGDLAGAEQRIAAERRIFPDRPELMLNLAAVYAGGGRLSDARALYAAVLDRPAVMMDMPNGSVRSSHYVATIGLTRLSPIASTR